MKFALEMLGYGPCHHMHEVMRSDHLTECWKRIGQGERLDWEHVFEGFRATVDWPSAAYWRDLAGYYPEAKIILTVRSPESWFASMEKTILKVLWESAREVLLLAPATRGRGVLKVVQLSR